MTARDTLLPLMGAFVTASLVLSPAYYLFIASAFHRGEEKEETWADKINQERTADVSGPLTPRSLPGGRSHGR